MTSTYDNATIVNKVILKDNTVYFHFLSYQLLTFFSILVSLYIHRNRKRVVFMLHFISKLCYHQGLCKQRNRHFQLD